MINLLKKLKLKNSDIVYVGDMKVDLRSAKNAKVDFYILNTEMGNLIIKI